MKNDAQIVNDVTPFYCNTRSSACLVCNIYVVATIGYTLLYFHVEVTFKCNFCYFNTSNSVTF